MRKDNTGMLRSLAIPTALAVGLGGGSALADPGHGRRAFAAGAPGDPKKPARTVEITMTETDGKMLYAPDRVEVKRGEQIRFVLKNVGKVDHEFMLDTTANNAKHKTAMEKNPDMEHDDPNGKRLAPNGSSDLVWRFTRSGTFEFACLIPGHYEAGMRGTVVVK
jgi:uncharacterized cupredoxin-like copper-binding protein